jgi:hypothetical protein
MKYTIEGLSQQKLIDLNLDNTDALIIRWFLDFKATDKMVKVKEYFWVKYDAIINDLPCIGIHNKEVMARRFKKFIIAGIMTGHTERNSKGTFSCYNTTDKILDLIYETTQKSNGDDSKVDTPPDLKVEPKDSSINLNQSINNIKNVGKPTIDKVESHNHLNMVKAFNDSYKSIYNKDFVWSDTKQLKAIKLLLKKEIPDLKKRLEDFYKYCKLHPKDKYHIFTPMHILSNINNLPSVINDNKINSKEEFEKRYKQTEKEFNELKLKRGMKI